MRSPGSRNVRNPLWQPLLAAQQRERQRLLSEMVEVRGFMPLLMKRRNGEDWSREDMVLLHAQLRALRHISPYLLVLALPGSFALIPALAWWLDRRRQRRSPDHF